MNEIIFIRLRLCFVGEFEFEFGFGVISEL